MCFCEKPVYKITPHTLTQTHFYLGCSPNLLQDAYRYWCHWFWNSIWYCSCLLPGMLSFNSMASKPIIIRWIRTGSQPDWKFMYSIELQTVFNEYWNKDHIINTNYVSPGLRPHRANKTGFNLSFLILISAESSLKYDAKNIYYHIQKFKLSLRFK